MKPWLLVLLFLQMPPASDAPVPHPDAMRYVRAIYLPDVLPQGQACAVIDGAIYSHAAPSLADMRIFPVRAAGDAHEVPYAITLSEAVTEDTESARVLNPGARDGRIEFDLEMPHRAYTDVTLNLIRGSGIFSRRQRSLDRTLLAATRSAPTWASLRCSILLRSTSPAIQRCLSPNLPSAISMSRLLSRILPEQARLLQHASLRPWWKALRSRPVVNRRFSIRPSLILHPSRRPDARAAQHLSCRCAFRWSVSLLCLRRISRKISAATFVLQRLLSRRTMRAVTPVRRCRRP